MSAVNPLPPTDVPSDKRPYEPSMEEILASIRRIIADDQSLPSKPIVRDSAPGAFPPLVKEPQRPIPPADRASPADVAAPTSQIHFERGPVDRPREAAPAQAQVHASVTAEPLLESGMAHGPIAAPQFAMPDGPVGDDFLQRQVPDHPAQAPSPPAPPRIVVLSEPAAPPAPLPEKAAEEEPLYDTPIEPAPSHTPPVERPQLFSAATDSAVSAAFNMLAASRLADNSDELMTLAREMIRPLLRTWIDDNLPSMVERMVRAEIERVARGGR